MSRPASFSLSEIAMSGIGGMNGRVAVGIKARIKIFREEFATWRRGHELVICGHFKNGQPTAGNRSPTCLLLFGIARATDHCDVTRIGLNHIALVCASTNPIVVCASLFVRDGMPHSKPQIKHSHPYRPQ